LCFNDLLTEKLVFIAGKNMATVGDENVANDGVVVQDGGNQQIATQVYFSVNV